MLAKLRLETNFGAVKLFRCRCLGLLLASLLLALPACQRPEEPVPPTDLLSREQMIALLARLHLLEARVENSRLSPDSSRALYLSQQRVLLQKSAVTDSAFQRSYRYYTIHRRDLDEIYGAVIDTLGRWGKRLDPKAPIKAPIKAAPVPAWVK